MTTLNRGFCLCALAALVGLALASCTSKPGPETTTQGPESSVAQEADTADTVVQTPTSEDPARQSDGSDPAKDLAAEHPPNAQAAGITIEEIRVLNSSIALGDEVILEIRISNSADARRSRTLLPELNNSVLEPIEVAVEGLSETTRVLNLLPETAGEHIIAIDGQSVAFSVLPSGAKTTNTSELTLNTSIRLLGIDRRDEGAVFRFWIEKGQDDWVASAGRVIEVADDHGNTYTASLGMDLGGASAKAQILAPPGLGYIETLTMDIPPMAPVESISVDGKHLDLRTHLGESLPDPADWPARKAQFGEAMQVGRWITCTAESIEPTLGGWNLLLQVANSDYNTVETELELGLQHKDGTISWRRRSIEIEGISQELISIALPTEVWISDRPAEPRYAFVRASNESTADGVLGVFLLAPDSLPPVVGQGPDDLAEVFRAAYEQGGGKDALGAPSNRPEWFRGNVAAYDSDDILYQFFPAAPRWGSAAIAWDSLGGAHRAILVPGLYWQSYSILGGPYHESESGVALGAPLRYQDGYLQLEGGALENSCLLDSDERGVECISYIPPPYAVTDYESGNGTQIAFSPDSSTLCVLGRSGYTTRPLVIRVDEPRSVRFLDGDVSTFTGLVYSPDGRYIAATHNDNSISLWDAETLTLIKRFVGHRRLIRPQLSFSRDGATLVTSCPDDIRIWDVSTGRVVAEFAEHNEWRTAYYFAPQGDSLIVVEKYAENGDSVEFIDVDTGLAVGTLDCCGDELSALHLSSDHGILATAAYDRSVALWDVETYEPRSSMLLPGTATALAIHPDGNFILIALASGSITLWSIREERELATIHLMQPRSDSSERVETLALSPDGKTLVAASWDDKLRFWKMDEVQKGVLGSAATTRVSQDNLQTGESETTGPAEGATSEAVAIVRGIPVSREQLDSIVSRSIAEKEFSDLQAGYGLSWKEALQGPNREHYVQALREQELRNLVTDTLLQLEVSARGVVISDDDIESELQRQLDAFLNAQRWTEEQFSQWLEAQGEDLSLYLAGQRPAAWRTLAQHAIVGEVQLTREELLAYFETHRQDYANEERVHASHILVDTYEEAEDILATLGRGASFSSIAEDRSACPTAESGGDLGWFTRGQMVPEFEEAAFALSSGELSDPTRTDYGYHIILVHEHELGASPAFEDVIGLVREDLASERKSEDFNSWLEDAWANDVVVFQ